MLGRMVFHGILLQYYPFTRQLLYARFLPRGAARMKQHYYAVWLYNLFAHDDIAQTANACGSYPVHLSAAKPLREAVITHCTCTIQRFVGHNSMLCEDGICTMTTVPVRCRLSSDSR